VDSACDVDYGLGNKTAYLKIDNPQNLNVTLKVTYYPYTDDMPVTAKWPHNTTTPTITVGRPKVVTICGLNNGTVYVQQQLPQPSRTITLFSLPIATPRNAVLQPGETTTITITPAMTPTLTIAIPLFLAFITTIRPKIKRAALYAIPALERILEKIIISDAYLFIYISTPIILFVLIVYLIFTPGIIAIDRDPIVTFMGSLLTWILFALITYLFYFRRHAFIYIFSSIAIIILIAIYYQFNLQNFIIYIFILVIILVLLSKSTSLESLLVTNIIIQSLILYFLLYTLIIGLFSLIYYNVNFGKYFPWTSPHQLIAELGPLPIMTFIIGLVLVYLILFYLFPLWAIPPPAWWLIGTGLFYFDEIAARSYIRKLLTRGEVVFEVKESDRKYLAVAITSDLNQLVLSTIEGNEIRRVDFNKAELRIVAIREHVRLHKKDVLHLLRSAPLKTLSNLLLPPLELWVSAIPSGHTVTRVRGGCHRDERVYVFSGRRNNVIIDEGDCRTVVTEQPVSEASPLPTIFIDPSVEPRYRAVCIYEGSLRTCFRPEPRAFLVFDNGGYLHIGKKKIIQWFDLMHAFRFARTAVRRLPRGKLLEVRLERSSTGELVGVINVLKPVPVRICRTGGCADVSSTERVSDGDVVEIGGVRAVFRVFA